MKKTLSSKEIILLDTQLSVHNSIDIQDKLLWSLINSKIQKRQPIFENIRDYAFPYIIINKDKAYIESLRYIFPSIFTPLTLKKFCINIINNHLYNYIYNMAGSYLEVLDIIHPDNNSSSPYLNRYNSVYRSYLFSIHSNSDVLIDDKIKFRTIIDTIAGENWDRIGFLYYEMKNIEKKLNYINYCVGLSETNLNENDSRDKCDYYEARMMPFKKSKYESFLCDIKVELDQLIIDKIHL